MPRQVSIQASPPKKQGLKPRLPMPGSGLPRATAGATVATIRIDNKEHVWVNGKKVKAKRSDGALVFRDGMITYTIQGDRRLKGEDYWSDSDAKTKGPIHAE